MFLNGLKDFKIVKISNGATTGTSAVTSNTFAMDGFDSVLIIADLAAVTDNCVLSLKAQDGAASNGSDAADITGATTGNLTASSSGNGQLVLDLHLPKKEYVTAVLGRTTQAATVNSITAILYNAHNKPVTQPATVLKSATVEATT
jgi:hypothetical protein